MLIIFKIIGETAGAFRAAHELHGPREHARRLLPEALGGARQHGEDLAVDRAPDLPGATKPYLASFSLI